MVSVPRFWPWPWNYNATYGNNRMRNLSAISSRVTGLVAGEMAKVARFGGRHEVAMCGACIGAIEREVKAKTEAVIDGWRTQGSLCAQKGLAPCVSDVSGQCTACGKAVCAWHAAKCSRCDRLLCCQFKHERPSGEGCFSQHKHWLAFTLR